MNRRASHRSLDHVQCKVLEHAWHEASRIGYPLNALISVRPGAELSPLDHANLVAQFWNCLGVWSRRITKKARGTPTFHCLLVREAEPGSRRNAPGVGEHFHALVHVPPRGLAALTDAVPLWMPGADTHVRRANQKIEITPYRKIKSAIGYLTKQRTQQAQWATAYRRRKGGIVLGKRYRITANLRASAVTQLRTAEAAA